MSDHDCFVEFRAGFADHDVVLLAGDRVAMQWLARQLRSSRAFTVGIAGPFESVAGVTLTGVGSERGETRIVRDGARFRWILSRHSRDAYAARAEALYSGAGGGHQYLDADSGGPITVVLSLGEGYRPGG